MANKKINELEQTTDISDTDLLIIETENGTRSVSLTTLAEKVNTSALGSLIAIYTLIPSNTDKAGIKISGKCTITANGYLSNKNSNTNGWAFNEMYLSKLVVDDTTSTSVGHLYSGLTIPINKNIELVVNENSNDSTITVCIYGNKDDIIKIDTINTSFPVWSALK